MVGVCYDIEGNSVDCGGSDAIGYSSSGSASGDISSGLNLTSSSPSVSPAAAMASDTQNNGGSALSGFFGSLPSLVSAIEKPLVGQTTSSNLRLQVNPTTGAKQYFNPSTGQYVGGPIGASGAFGSSSFMLMLFAVVVAFFAFGGRKRALA